MNSSLKKLPQALIELNKKAEKLDAVLQDVRIAINNVFWDFIELRKEKKKLDDKGLYDF